MSTGSAGEWRPAGSAEPSRAGTSKEIANAPERLAAVEALERELDARRRGRYWRLGLGLAALVAAALAFGAWRDRQQPAPVSPFITQRIEQRDIQESIESSGKLRPLNEVKVGTQVSGRVVDVHVDFNDVVKKGQLLAEIDPRLFGAQVSQAQGQLASARAQLERSKASQKSALVQLERTRQLKAESIASQAELDQAESALDVANAEVTAASAQITRLGAELDSASTTLGYTKIYSPIDGTIIDRQVDPGQTVAASFAAPLLFVIARDLSEMQVLADIDEADVGKIKEGMTAKIRVDAFPDQAFAGTVTQIRYNPTEVQGVVTYAAVLDVKNDQLALRPGMTAVVSIIAQSVQGVTAVPSAALRFKPKELGELARAPALEPGQRRLFLAPPGPPRTTDASGAEAAAAPPLESKLVRIGISDGAWTELRESPLAAGAEVVTGERAVDGDKRRKFLGIF
ncbi:MAG TPA: efflux RND transporter periplasmic adaptor subunit [Polyangiaceae bacterium]|nr:efflux RND transporter periplasmic adaptor subunit [Polyangiaceae bacterium]